MSEENLVKSGILDALAIKNRELAEIKRVENEKALIAKKNLRNQNLVRSYLYDRFPLVSDIPEITEKEFPSLFKRARKYYLAKIGVASAIALLPTGGIAVSLIIFFTTVANMPPITASPYVKGIALLCLIGGFLTTGLFSWLSCISIAKIRKYINILTHGKEII